MHEMILCKLGEVVLKGLNRRSFEMKLMSNLRRRTARFGRFRVYSKQSTIYVEPAGEACDLDGAYDACKRVFGIIAVARALPCAKEKEAILDTAKTYLSSALTAARSFKVESKRADKTFPMTSIQLSQWVGGHLHEAFPHLTVDVHHPDLTVYVEVREEAAYVHAPAEPAAKGSRLRPAELDRYARHIMLREIGGPGQRRLQAARVLVVGAGGLGSPVCLYLAAAGVGQISVIDDDRVESSNLQRQIIHRDQDIGLPKAQSAAAAMRALNPFIETRALLARLTEDNAEPTFAGHDLIIDGTDNFDTRCLVNQTATRLGIPLLSGAITQWEGQVTLCDPAKGGPCYACIFPERPAPGMVPTCAEAGVAAPLPGVIGSIMAMEAVKYLTGAGETLAGRLMIHDALYAETRTITVRPRAGCAVCGGGSQA